MKLRRIKVGDAITAGWLNALIDLANGCNLTVGDGGSLNMTDGPDGYTLDAIYEQPIWGQTTGAISSGTYPFKEVIEASGGTWVDGTLTDVAYELNGNTSVATGKRAKFWRTAQGTWIFNAGTC